MSNSQNGTPEPKGIDDALNAGVVPETLSGDAAKEFLAQVERASRTPNAEASAHDEENGDHEVEFEWPEDPLPLPAEIELPDLQASDLPAQIRQFCITQSENL